MKETFDKINAGIIAYLNEIEDPRKKRGVRYPFKDLLLMAVYAILAGHSEATEIEFYVELNFQYFKDLIQLKDVPSHDTFSRVLQLVDMDELGNHIGQWISDNFPEVCTKVNGNKVLHVDGKAVRAASKKSEGQQPIYHLNSMYEGEGISLNIQRIEDKENEISCLPTYLQIFDLKNTIVTIDAIGCNKNVIDTIIGKGGHYMVPVKENQKKLFNAIHKEAEKLEKEGKFEKLPSSERIIKKHGRTETMKLTLLKNTAFIYEELGVDSFYGNVARVGIIDKTTTKKERGEEKTSTQRSIVITDMERITPENMLKIKLSHWNVEAQHWLLDVQLNEDKMTARKGNAVTNGAILRRFCVLIRKYSPEYESKPLSRFLMANEHDIRRIEKMLFMDAQK